MKKSTYDYLPCTSKELAAQVGCDMRTANSRLFSLVRRGHARRSDRKIQDDKTKRKLVLFEVARPRMKRGRKTNEWKRHHHFTHMGLDDA